MADPLRPPDERPAGQPWLHDLEVAVLGTATVLGDRSGDLTGTGVQGLFVDDVRVLSRLEVRLAGRACTPVAAASSGARSEFLASARQLGDHGPDPTVEVRRRRTVTAAGMSEVVEVVSRSRVPITTELTVTVAGDGAAVHQVKAGLTPAPQLVPLAGEPLPGWASATRTVRLAWAPAPTTVRPAEDAYGTVAVFPLELLPDVAVRVQLDVRVTRDEAADPQPSSGAGGAGLAEVTVTGSDPRLGPTFAAALDDVDALLLRDPLGPHDVFVAAGTPWFLTLFGRDSLWAARFLLPFGTRLAGGTLRALARRQGRHYDPLTAEAPGKIPHEVRRPESLPSGPSVLPALYYGTVDATPLWLTLLRDAWRWGLPAAEVAALLPAAEAAVGWLTRDAAPDADRLLKYVDSTGLGLANQGWKDSSDGIRWRDGRLADVPIALVEAQAYAVEAAEAAGELFEAFGRDGASDLRAWAAALREELRRRYWVEPGPDEEAYLGIAVDGSGKLVDGVASNMGHVLGTGALSAAEEARVARRLTGPELLGPYGVATLASGNGGYNPIGYHTGSVWTHDTAIAALGLARSGHRQEAARVGRALLASAAAFGFRWPELYADTGVLGRPAPYPASCRPQGWAAASVGALLSVALGFEPDAPNGRLVLRPVRPAAFGAMTVTGLRIGEALVSLRSGADGSVEVLEAPDGLDLVVL